MQFKIFTLHWTKMFLNFKPNTFAKKWRWNYKKWKIQIFFAKTINVSNRQFLHSKYEPGVPNDNFFNTKKFDPFVLEVSSNCNWRQNKVKEVEIENIAKSSFQISQSRFLAKVSTEASDDSEIIFLQFMVLLMNTFVEPS